MAMQMKINIKEWIRVPLPITGDSKSNKCYILRRGNFVYLATREVNSHRRERYHLVAISETGASVVPYHLGTEVTLGICCSLVVEHQERFKQIGGLAMDEKAVNFYGKEVKEIKDILSVFNYKI